MAKEVESRIGVGVSDLGCMNEVGGRPIGTVSKEVSTKQLSRDAEKETLQTHLVHFGGGNPVLVDTSSIVVARIYGRFHGLSPVSTSEKHCIMISHPVGVSSNRQGHTVDV